MKRPAALIAMACALAISCASAEPSVPAPGEYVTSGGWGVLRVTRGANHAALFSIRSEGANAHSCALDGELRGGSARVAELPQQSPCVVRLTMRGDAVEVSTNEDPSCHPSFCGLRAGFTGLYLRTPPGCSAAERRKTEDAFKRAYDGKDFDSAKVLARGLLDACTDTMNSAERSRLGNDLAVTEFHLGHYAECMAALQPLADDAARSDDELRAQQPPADYERELPIVQATRTNLRLCETLKSAR